MPRQMKTHKPKISIVVSIYNIEHYLERCLKSLAAQTYSYFEVICVDDGSTDSCPAVCDKWAKSDPRFLVIHKVNSGLGYARNTGLEEASGDYLLFIDGDDSLSDDSSLEKIVNGVSDTAPDVAMYGYCLANDEDNVFDNVLPEKWEIYKGNEIIRKEVLPAILFGGSFRNIKGLSSSAWCCAFKRSFLLEHDLRFVSERELISEDIYFVLQYMNFCDSFITIPEICYSYRYNPDSLSRSYRSDRAARVIEWHKASRQYCINCNYSSLVMEALDYCFINNMLACLKGEVAQYDSTGIVESYKTVRKICSDSNVRAAFIEHGQVSIPLKKRLLIRAIHKGHTFLVYFLIFVKCIVN